MSLRKSKSKRDGVSRLKARGKASAPPEGAPSGRPDVIVTGASPGSRARRRFQAPAAAPEPPSSVAADPWRYRIQLRDALLGPAEDVQPDALIVDAPWSARTHRAWSGAIPAAAGRAPIGYPCWSVDQIATMVGAWAGAVRGWWVVLTDHVLWGAWEAELRASGLYTFAPVVAVVWGSSVRLRGDGPSAAAVQILVARPRRRPWSNWGTTPGAYQGPAEEKRWSGGKPLWLMRELVRHYSRPGELVADPCCGGGTTATAALELGRRAYAADLDVGAVDATRVRLWLTGRMCEAGESARRRQLKLWAD